MRLFFVMFMLSVFVVSLTQAAVNTDETLILYFSFDELDDGIAVDHSQYGNNGVLNGDPQLADGKFGKAMKFNGTTDWVEVPHDTSLTVETGVTVMAWINPERLSGPNNVQWQGILSKGNSPRSYSFYTETANQCLHFSAGGGSTCNTVIQVNEWHHVVGQVDNDVHRYWINGENVGESGGKSALPGTGDTSNVFVGTSAEGASRLFQGLIDEVRIWNRALSEEEVIWEMNIGVERGTAVEALDKLATRWGYLKSIK